VLNSQALFAGQNLLSGRSCEFVLKTWLEDESELHMKSDSVDCELECQEIVTTGTVSEKSGSGCSSYLPGRAPNATEPHAESTVQAHVRALGQADWPAWDALVEASPQGTHFHSTHLLETNRQRYKLIGCFKGDALLGGFAYELLAPKVAGHSPLTPYSGIVLACPAAKHLTVLSQHKHVTFALANHLKRDLNSIDCHMGPEVIDVQPFTWAGYNTSVRYTYRIDLTDLDRVWNEMEDKRRNDIRKAERDGIIVDSGGAISEVLALAEMTFERQDEKFGYHELALRRYQSLLGKGKAKCFIARNPAGKAVAGAYVEWDWRHAYYLAGGYDPAQTHRGAGALAIWEAIKYAKRNLDLQRFDFAGSTIRPIERFFRDFGGTLTPTYVVSWQRPSLARDLRRACRRLGRLYKAILNEL